MLPRVLAAFLPNRLFQYSLPGKFSRAVVPSLGFASGKVSQEVLMTSTEVLELEAQRHFLKFYLCLISLLTQVKYIHNTPYRRFHQYVTVSFHLFPEVEKYWQSHQSKLTWDAASKSRGRGGQLCLLVGRGYEN